jgi:predicted nucleotidyltransferase
VLIEIEANLTVHVASVAGLTLLKLAAWMDRGRESNKDAADLYRLLTTYADAGNTDRLYETELDLLEGAEFDIATGGRGTSRSRCCGNMRCPDIASSPVRPGGGR